MFALVLSYANKIGSLIYCIWKAENIFIILYLYLKAHNVTAIRGNNKLNKYLILALFEKNHFIIPLCIVVASIFCHFFLFQFI